MKNTRFGPLQGVRRRVDRQSITDDPESVQLLISDGNASVHRLDVSREGEYFLCHTIAVLFGSELSLKLSNLLDC